MMYVEPCLQIRSNSIFQYNIIPRFPHSKDAQAIRDAKQSKLFQNMVECPTYSGVLTAGAKKRLTKAIEFLVMSTPEKYVISPRTGKEMKFRMSFITLTVYSTDRNINGKEAHKNLLEPFLQWMRRQHGCQVYLWKAELQKRGQIHYHVTCDSYIAHQDVRAKWNELQKRSGYLDSFHKRYGHWNAASTEVKGVKHEQKLSGYLVKEITKSFQNSKSIGGKIWDCSINLKSAKYFVTVADGEYQQRISEMIDREEIKAVYTDHCTIFRVVNKSAFEVLTDKDKREYRNIMHSVRTKEVVRVKKINKEKDIFEEYSPPVIEKRITFVPQLNLFSSS